MKLSMNKESKKIDRNIVFEDNSYEDDSRQRRSRGSRGSRGFGGSRESRGSRDFNGSYESRGSRGSRDFGGSSEFGRKRFEDKAPRGDRGRNFGSSKQRNDNNLSLDEMMSAVRTLRDNPKKFNDEDNKDFDKKKKAKKDFKKPFGKSKKFGSDSSKDSGRDFSKSPRSYGAKKPGGVKKFASKKSK